MRKYLNKYAKFSFSGFLETVRTGDISEMQDLLHDRDTLGYKNLNVNGFLYDSPLHEAVDRGDIDVCRMLLKCNFDVNNYWQIEPHLILRKKWDIIKLQSY